jgi:predicted Zn-dependent protease
MYKFFIIFITLFFSFSVSVSEITFKKNTLLQDDEMEALTTTILQKMFHVAHIKGKPTIYFVVTKDINAAATLNRTVIINTGFILFCKNIEEFIGVLAHEVIHIKADHPSLGELNAGQAAIPGFLTMAVGGIAALALGSPEILMAGLAGGMGVAQRNVLKYSRTQENMADAGAIDILEKLNWPIDGLQTFLKSLDKKYNMKDMDPYLSTHPITSERFQKIGFYLEKHPQKRSIPDDLKTKFLRIQAKIAGFTEPTASVFKRYPSSDQSTEAHYARAIAYYRTHKTEKFNQEMDILLKKFPNDTYFLELKGQFFIEAGDKEKALKILESARENRKNKEGLDLIYAHALLETNKQPQKVIDILTPLIQKDSSNIWAWRMLSIAYGKEKKENEASGCLAEEAYLKRDYKLALTHAKKAVQSKNSNIRDRAKTLIEEIEREKKRGNIPDQ